MTGIGPQVTGPESRHSLAENRTAVAGRKVARESVPRPSSIGEDAVIGRAS
jgi:hypothetical protein